MPDAALLPAGARGGLRRQIERFVPLDAGGPLTKQALAQGTIDVGLVFSSDGGVSALDLVVLADDQALQTVDNLVPPCPRRPRPRRTWPP